MEQVRMTGIYFIGECDLKLENCLAKSPAPITAVKLEQNGTQVNVCKSCLGKMLDSGVWQLKGARFVARHDYALISRDGNPLVALEVKRKPRVPTLNEAEWAQAFARNLAVHGMSTAPRLVLLAVLDGNLYAWKTTDLFRDLKPLVVVETNSALKDLGLAPPRKRVG